VTRLAVALGIFTVVAGIALVTMPLPVLEFGRSILSPSVMYGAALFRILFGFVLLAAAPMSRFPTLLRTFGAVLIIAGIAAALLDVGQAQSIIDWMLGQGALFTRLWASVVAVIGAAVVYATISPHRAAT
jgi:membrane protein HdeD